MGRDPVRAVDRVTFDVRPGEVFGLLGPNGAGKTTCLRILSTVLKPTAGDAIVAGYDVVEHPEAVRGKIGFMSGNTGIYDRMTAWELVEYYGRLYGMPEVQLQERLEEIFETTADERDSGSARLENVHGNAAESVDRANDRSRSARAHLR